MELTEQVKKGLELLEKSRTLTTNTTLMINSSTEVPPAEKHQLRLIRHEINELNSFTRTTPKTSVEQQASTSQTKQKASPLIRDSPTITAKRVLTKSIREVNYRVKCSRAGKRSVGPLLNKQAVTPDMFKTAENFNMYLTELKKTRKFKLLLGQPRERLLPYVSLVSGMVEEPIHLPNYEEYLVSVGADHLIKTGTDELFYRIDRAVSKLENIKKKLYKFRLKLENGGPRKYKIESRNATSRPSPHKPKATRIAARKTEQLRETLQSYYSPSPQKVHKPPVRRSSMFSTAGLTMEETLRNFYRMKATENEKVQNILLKLAENRPFTLKSKTSLIEKGDEPYRNHLHTLSKFNGYRSEVENYQRERQQHNLRQGVSYLRTLEQFKNGQYYPSEPEQLLLEVWKRTVEKGWIIGVEEFELMVNSLSQNELQSEALLQLVNALKISVVEPDFCELSRNSH